MQLAGSDVTCVRGGREVFAALNFAVDGGEALAVTGRNGAGKSSLLRLIAGLLSTAGGSISLQGGDAERHACRAMSPARASRRPETVTHGQRNSPILARFSRRREGLAPGRLPRCGADRPSRRPAGILSLRRAAAAACDCAACRDPKRPVWLLDEPTSALDTHAQSLLADLMTKHLATGGLIVAATHDALGISARELRIGGRRDALSALIRRARSSSLRVGGGALIGVLFFLSVVVLMPFAVGPDLALLKRIGPAILWLGAMLASLLTLDRLFTADHEDGSLDLIAMSRTPLELTCIAKGAGALDRVEHPPDRSKPDPRPYAQSRRCCDRRRDARPHCSPERRRSRSPA